VRADGLTRIGQHLKGARNSQGGWSVHARLLLGKEHQCFKGIRADHPTSRTLPFSCPMRKFAGANVVLCAFLHMQSPWQSPAAGL
jgi:hypothetical protein